MKLNNVEQTLAYLVADKLFYEFDYIKDDKNHRRKEIESYLEDWPDAIDEDGAFYLKNIDTDVFNDAFFVEEVLKVLKHRLM